MVATILGLARVPTPDDAADALAVAICVANRERGGDQQVATASSIARPSPRSPVVRRLRPRRARGADPGARRCQGRAPACSGPRRRATQPVIALGRRRRRGHRGRFARPRGRRDRLPGLRRAGGPGLGPGRRPAQALHPPPRARGPAGAVRVPHARGARLLRAAADGHRGRAEGRPGDRRQPAGRRPPAGDHRAGPGRCSSSIPGIGKKLAERIIFELKEKVAAAGVAARSAAGAGGAGETEVVAALQALGYSPGRGARRVPGRAARAWASAASLEERVKAALRTLVRD